LTVSELRLRAYRDSDLEALITLFRESVRRVARRDYTQAQVEAWAPGDVDRAEWARRRAASETLIAERDGAILGFAGLAADGLVDMMYVHADQQRRGIAGALLRRIEESARARGLARLHADSSITARPFFERHGFRVLAEQTVTRRGETLTNYRMEKVLG